MKNMQMSSYQRFFCGWIESQKKETQDDVNTLAEKLYEKKSFFEYQKEGNFIVRLIHCEDVFDEFKEVMVEHTNYKLYTQMCFLIILPSDYYQRFVIIQDCI